MNYYFFFIYEESIIKGRMKVSSLFDLIIHRKLFREVGYGRRE